MTELIYNLISIAVYVLYALGLYTIAQRRGIANAWLAWIPMGNLWILGCIADDYVARTAGRKPNFRTWLIILNVVTAVLLAAFLGCCIWVLSYVLTVDELIDFCMVASGAESDRYAASQTEVIDQIIRNAEDRMTDEVGQKIMVASLVMVGVAIPMLIASVALAVIEYICFYRLFASCDPQYKWMYFLVGMLIGGAPVFVFLCRNKDLGIFPKEPPTGYMPPAQEENPWGQN